MLPIEKAELGNYSKHCIFTPLSYRYPPEFVAKRNPVRGDMNDSNAAVDKLQRIQDLWEELRRTSPNSPQYERIITRIHALSVTYQSLIDTPYDRDNPE